MLPFDAGLAFAPVDSARVVSHVYSASLLAMLPLALTAMAALLLRRSPAGVRVVVWRAAVVALLTLCVSHLLPARWTAWIVPAGLAEPFVVLGRVMVSSGGPLLDTASYGVGGDVLLVSRILAVVYSLGCALALVPLLRGLQAARRLADEARPVTDAAACEAFACAVADAGIRRPVTLLVHDAVTVPVTFGMLAPRVVLPRDAASWEPAQLRAALLHELAHVQAADVAFAVVARVAAALFWFNPAVWLIERRLHEDCELAADDRVLSAGVKASVYGSLLLAAGDRLHAPPPFACALASTGGLRGRLAAVLQPGRDTRSSSRRVTRAVLAGALVSAGAAGAVELAPTRDVLQALMQDARWESRAYAVVGLAPRPDSLPVARAAAVSDPDPQVRAWASYALARHGAAPLDSRPSTR